MRGRTWLALIATLVACNSTDDPSSSARSGLRSGTEQKLTAPSPSDGDWMGFSVDVDGDTAVVGAHGDDTRGADAGAAYVFVRGSGGTWSVQQKLTASDGTAFDYFGWAVAVDGDTVAVGARRDDDRGMDYGSAYVFTRSSGSWTERVKLFPSDGAPGDRFGWSVDLDGGTLLVGAVTHDGPAMDSGAAYVFVGSGASWTEQQKLVASDGTGGDFLGQALALDGDTALLGADEDNVGGEDSGSAYVFVRSGTTWSQQQKLTASDSAASDYFANGVAVDGDTALIGAWGQDPNGADSGAAYVFVRSGTTWSQQQKITPSDGAAGDSFGRAVALAGDAAIVGAFLDDDIGADAGAVYVFERSGTTWTQRSETTASDTAAGDHLGWAVATDGTRAIVGARYDDHSARDGAGAAYLFALRASTPADAGVDAGSDAGFDAGVDAGVDAGLDAGADAGVDAGFDAGADAGADAGLDAGADAGLDAGLDAGADAGSDAGVDAGFDAGSDAGFDAGFDAGLDAGADAGAPDAGTPVRDAGAPRTDAATPARDAGDPPRDAAPGDGGADHASGDDAGATTAGGSPGDGGGCSAGGARTAPATWLAAVFALLFRRRRQERHT